MTNPETAREEAVNPLLGQLLRARGVPGRAERPARRHPHIRFELPSGELVLIERKWASARSDLDARQYRAVITAREHAGRLEYQRED